MKHDDPIYNRLESQIQNLESQAKCVAAGGHYLSYVKSGDYYFDFKCTICSLRLTIEGQNLTDAQRKQIESVEGHKLPGYG